MVEGTLWQEWCKKFWQMSYTFVLALFVLMVYVGYVF